MPEPVTFQASLDKTNCVKLSGDKSGSVVLSVPASEFHTLAELAENFSMKPLFVTVVLRGDVVEGKKAE